LLTSGISLAFHKMSQPRTFILLGVFFFLISCSVQKYAQSLVEDNRNQDVLKAIATCAGENSRLLKLMMGTKATDRFKSQLFRYASFKQEALLSILGVFPRGNLALNLFDNASNTPSFRFSPGIFYMPLDLAGNLRNIIKGNLELAEAAKNDLFWLERVLKYEVGVNYVAMFYLRKQKEAILSSCERISRMKEIVRLKLEAGLSAKDEFLFLEMQEKLCYNNNLELGVAFLESMKFLKALFADEDFSEQSISADSLNFCGELQLKSELPVLEVALLRDDLKASISRLSASSFFSQARFRELLPSVTLKSEVFRTSENLEKAFGSDYAGFSNLLIEAPIFDIQSKLVAVFKGRLLEEEAVHALNDKLNSVMSEIFWSINLINLSSNRLRLLETALQDFSQIKEISDQRLQAGLISVFDWYNTEKTFFEIEASRLNSQMLYWVAWLTILKNVPDFDNYFIFN